MFDQIGAAFARFTSRAATDPISFEAGNSAYFGPGIGNQPSHETLLRENKGVTDTATRAIANRVSTLNPQVKVTRNVGGGTTEDEILDDHPLKMLLDKPHPSLTRAQLLRLTAQWVVTVGEAYWLKVGTAGLGVPSELHPMPPGSVFPFVQQNVVAGYRVRDGNGRESSLPADVVIRFFFPDPENMWGSEGYLAPSGVTADANKFAGQHLRSHYENDATPKMALEAGADAVPFTTTEKNRFFASWRARYHSRGGSEQGAPGILPTNYTLKELTQQYGSEVVPLLEFWQDQLLMGMGTPRSVLGQVVSGDRSSAEVNKWVFDDLSVSPISNLIADGLTMQLAPDFDPALFVQFESFVAADKKFELERETADLTNKVRSPQQVLRDRGSDPDDAPWGELPVGQVGQVPYTGEDDFGFDDGPEMEEDLRERSQQTRAAFWTPDNQFSRERVREKRYVPIWTRALRKIIKQQRDSVLARLKALGAPRSRAITAGDLFEPDEWVALFQKTTEPLRQALFLDVLREVAPALGLTPEDGGEFIFTEQMQQVLREQGATMIRQVNETTGKRLATAISQNAADVISGELATGVGEGESLGELTKRVQRVFRVRKEDASTIARTEVLTASTEAQIESFKQAGVETHTWLTNKDPAVRDSHLIDGQSVEVGQPFTLADGSLALGPGVGYGAPMSAGNRINCRCTVLPDV